MSWIELGLRSLWSINWDRLNWMSNFSIGSPGVRICRTQLALETAGDLRAQLCSEPQKHKQQKQKHDETLTCMLWCLHSSSEISILARSCMCLEYWPVYLPSVTLKAQISTPVPNKCVTIQLQEAGTLRSPDQAQHVRAWNKLKWSNVCCVPSRELTYPL